MTIEFTDLGIGVEKAMGNGNGGRAGKGEEKLLHDI